MEQQLLSAYQQIYNLSKQMIALAQSQQWDTLIELEMAYISAVEKTGDFVAVTGSPMALQEILHHWLQQILDNEAELKRLLQLRMDELRVLIGQSTQQNVVNNTYGQFYDQALLLGEPQPR
ncbi:MULTISPECIES: flagella biosynthesis regulatory protein FliT [unclassified Serratia (in: enterobacteria)]|uniref:flagella biosynthesis regulatory protein FliT n=1 Tax=unclassified Serratia (in: enterobacteria) TaxID=2647522 RepID=UPI00307613AD